MKKKALKILILLLFVVALSYGQQFSYKPLNPAFGGEVFNYNWLLNSANAQNGFTASRDRAREQSDLERFGENINSQILNQISRALLAQQVEAVGDFTQEGTFVFGTLNVEVFESDEGLVINILDTSNGEQTQVIVPNS